MDLHAGRPLTRSEIAEALHEARARTLLLIAPLGEEDLRVQHDPLMSPIVWDLGHIAHFEEVWLLENIEGKELGREGLRGIYDPFRNPRAVRAGLDLPERRAAFGYLAQVRSEVLGGLGEVDLDADGPLLRDGYVFRMVLQHEYQHNETILQTLQLKGGAPYPAARAVGLPGRAPSAPEPGATVRIEAGRYPLGTDDRSEAYDNERPRHLVDLPAFEIDVHPVTNGAYLEFIADGGYDRRAVWSDEGWAWRQEASLTAPAYWSLREGEWWQRVMDLERPVDPVRPVCHVCFWEADAFARWAGTRLPTEAEWEVAGLLDPATGSQRRYPWGDEPPTTLTANVDQLAFDTAPVGAFPAGASAAGCHGLIGDVWEWTSSTFVGYPGYRTFPYPEYSEVFFGTEYRVLRGGSWATRSGAIRGTFRNWDYPIRRQIFSGFRCARDV
ncbi:MAG: ergothioneine biosynthesis protein EgtB [Gemmatimonadetes bacterium]|nr:ergothioneine biosynthesis protein EgtB [Gemmatimonadota bacterium]NNK63765.1 ergothioneine biosynthesis protein EgtB [Gemmatimonadota bacterium]